MELYERKRQAYELIDKLVSEGVPINIIYFKVATLFGFSERLVDKRVNQLKEIVKNVSQTYDSNKDQRTVRPKNKRAIK